MGPVSYIIGAAVLRGRTFMSIVVDGGSRVWRKSGAMAAMAQMREMRWRGEAAGRLGGGRGLVLGGSLRKPRQPVDTTLGWLRRGVGTAERPDCGLAGRGHIEGS